MAPRWCAAVSMRSPRILDFQHVKYRMNHSLIACLLISLCPPFAATAQDAAAADAATPAQLKRVLDLLVSPHATRRASGYKACRARGDAFKDTYFSLIEKANRQHGAALANVIRLYTGPGTPQAEAVATWTAWQDAAKPAAEFVLTDHHKEKPKLDEMDRLYATASLAWGRVCTAYTRLQKTGGEATSRIDSALTALRELHKEKAWCKPDEFDADDNLDIGDFEDEFSFGDDTTKYLQTHASMRTAIQALADVHAANDAAKWAGPAHKEFARILNDRRAVLGLQALLLEEKLSDACTGHSKEMIALGYFAHTSPVKENKDFGMRARNAGFTGSAGGECIFSGNASAAAAEGAWWYSDGHRLINYSRGSSILGIGPVGTMWTLNVGNM